MRLHRIDGKCCATTYYTWRQDVRELSDAMRALRNGTPNVDDVAFMLRYGMGKQAMLAYMGHMLSVARRHLAAAKAREIAQYGAQYYA